MDMKYKSRARKILQMALGTQETSGSVNETCIANVSVFDYIDESPEHSFAELRPLSPVYNFEPTSFIYELRSQTTEKFESSTGVPAEHRDMSYDSNITTCSESVISEDDEYVPSTSTSDQSAELTDETSPCNPQDYRELYQDTTQTTGIANNEVQISNSGSSNPVKLNEIYEQRLLKKKKRSHCIFCKDAVTNFERHLQRNHNDEKEVQEYLQFPVQSKERRDIISVLRKNGHFHQFMEGNIIPTYRKAHVTDKGTYIPCGYCKGIFKDSYLGRHSRKCKTKQVKQHGIKPLTASQTLIACASEYGETLAKMRLKSEVFCIMKGDAISLTAKTDPLICQFGENYLKKHKRPQMATVCSNKIRELARLLINYRQITGNADCSLCDLLKPEMFQQVVNAAKNIGGYNEENKSFRAPSLAAHIGTSMKQLCELFIKLLLQKSRLIRCDNIEDKLVEVTRFKKLIESHWTTEISSIAFKDLNEKKWQKPTILPLTRDILKFKECAFELAERSKLELEENPKNAREYKMLTQCTLAITIVFNRRRIGDVQYLKVEEYVNNITLTNIEEFELSPSEKLLTKKYKRVVAGGKGSRKIVILFPPIIQNFISTLLTSRNQSNIIPSTNTYLFAMPGKVKWTRGDTAIRYVAQKCGISPASISSNKLRKHIATVTQLLTSTLHLDKEEIQQFAQFMGHTEKTHDEFYVLPQDLYQTAKVSKLLIMIDKGKGKHYVGKALKDININPEEDYMESDSEDEMCNNIPELESEVRTSPSNISHSNNHDDMNPTKTVQLKRATWSQDEKDAVVTYFAKHIQNKVAPKKEETNKFKYQYPSLFRDKDWVKIKTYVYNQYRMKGL